MLSTAPTISLRRSDAISRGRAARRYRRGGKSLERCPLGGKVHVRAENAVHAAQGVLDLLHAGGARHPADRDLYRTDRHVVPQRAHDVDEPLGRDLVRIIGDGRALRGEVHGDRLHALGVLEPFFHLEHAARAAHALHGKLHAFDRRRHLCLLNDCILQGADS